LKGQDNSYACRSCETGKYAFGVANPVCEDCLPGTYADRTGAGSCTQCAMGHYQEYSGSKTCTTLCPVGKYSSLGQSACDDCATGKFASNEGTAECDVCPLGYSQSSPGQGGCVACAVGKSSNGTTGMVDCISCPPNKYANFVGTPDCYEQEREVPDNKDITATISVMAAMAVLVSILSFTYWHRDAIFGVSQSETSTKDDTIANRA